MHDCSNINSNISGSDVIRDESRKSMAYTRGVATSFGFRRRPSTAVPVLTDNAPGGKLSPEAFDSNGNGGHGSDSVESTSPVPSGLTTPRLAPPKKEAAASRINRFGFRQARRESSAPECRNNNVDKPRAKGGGKTVTIAPTVTRHKSAPAQRSTGIPQPAKFTLHSAQLPRPQVAVRVSDTKTAKTATNLNRKVSSASSRRSDDGSSVTEETEDSGVGSHTSRGGADENNSPTLGARRLGRQRPRHLEPLITSPGSFDVRDLDDSAEDGVVTEVAVIPLPRLPSVFSGCSAGLVRERALQYQRQVDHNRRKVSVTSSEGFSEDYGEEEKSFRDRTTNEKYGQGSSRLFPLSGRSFMRDNLSSGKDSSPPSSDEQDWQAGEALAELHSCSFSSSDESKDKSPFFSRTIARPSPTDSNILNNSITLPRDSLKSVLLTIEDPKFAAVAAASSGNLLEDETSPVDSLISSYTESEEGLLKNKKSGNHSSSGSKDINEKSPLSPASPGTPTNASLSLSEGRDFLIDDEIADQPALMFNETLTEGNSIGEKMFSEHHNISDSVATLVESTPKPARKVLNSCHGSPALRPRNPLLSRTASIDTLSPCESIASDDLMLDFEHSQSSGIDDSTDRLNIHEGSALNSLDEATIRRELETQDSDVAREWSSLLSHHSVDLPTSVSRSSFLRSRNHGPGGSVPSSVPDSPRSLDRGGFRGAFHHLPHSPLLRSARTVHGSPSHASNASVYDSDDSSLRLASQGGNVATDIVTIKTMLLKLKRVLQETDEDILMRNEPLNPFDNQVSLKNGISNGLSSEQSDLESMEGDGDLAGPSCLEMADLRRQILFLQSQLEDKERTVQHLQNQVTKYTLDSQFTPGLDRDFETCNAATQTDRVRPLSAGPSLLQNLPSDGSMGPLVSMNEHSRRARPQSMLEPLHSLSNSIRSPPLKLWRKPGEPPPPSRFVSSVSSLPRRANSKTRATTS